MDYKRFIGNILLDSGKVALKHFGKITNITQKDDPTQVVTEVDLAIEKMIINGIEEKYPDHSIIAEESGYKDKKSDYIWIIDPLDGTSNYAAGIPWYGNMIALLKNWEVIMSGIYLPTTDEMYLAEKGNGATRNGNPITTKQESDLKKCLVSFGTDPSEEIDVIKRYAEIYTRLLPRVRNLRSTNSAVDYVYAADGRLGGLINTNNALWDVAPISLIAKEAGMIVTDLKGKALDLKVTDNITTKYSLLIGSNALHPQLLDIVNGGQ